MFCSLFFIQTNNILKTQIFVYNVIMIKDKRTFFLGFFIMLIPALGLPTFWKMTFIVLSGITLVILSVKIAIPKRPAKRIRKKEKVTQVFVENSPMPKVDGISPNESNKE